MYQKLSLRKKNPPYFDQLKILWLCFVHFFFKLVYTHAQDRQHMSQIHKGVHLQSTEQNASWRSHHS